MQFFSQETLMKRLSVVVLLSVAIGPMKTNAAVEPPGLVTLFHDRPQGVPSDFVITPHGYFHPDCVVELGDHESVDSSGTVTSADGRTRSKTECLFPHFHRDGSKSTTIIHPPAISHSYIAFSERTGQGTQPGPASYLSANWTVPTDPPLQSNQIVYLFPGFEPPSTDTILQPVLGWNQGSTGWSISSWNCCVTGNLFHSSIVPVSAGQTLTGTVAGTGCNAVTGVCSNWLVTTASSSGAQTVLSTTSYEEQLTLTLGGALEVYNIDVCSKYPASNGTSFSNIVVRDINGSNLAQPTWNDVLFSVTPACQYNVETFVIFPFPSGTPTSRTDISWCAPMTQQQACLGIATCGTTEPDGCGGSYTCPACSCPLGDLVCSDGSCVRPPRKCLPAE